MIDRDFVGRVEHRRQSAADGACVARKAQGGKRLFPRRLKMQRGDLGEVEREAGRFGFSLWKAAEMPANNLSLIFAA
jgi:hypothetical protein